MTATVGAHYASVRHRLSPLLASLDESQWRLPVPACPGWEVRDVLAHLVGIIEDAFVGELTGPPSTEQTAREVDRHRTDVPLELLGLWNEASPAFEEALTSLSRWPAFIDVLSHEHDVRQAIGAPGQRASDDVMWAADLLTRSLPAGVQVVVDGEARGCGRDDASAQLSTSAFELLRLRMGRRSRTQVRAMPWSGDPMPILDELFVFGPAAADLYE